MCQKNELKKIKHRNYLERSPTDQIRNNNIIKINNDNMLLLDSTEYNNNP